MMAPKEFRGRQFEPIGLKRVLLNLGLAQAKFAAQVIQDNGRPLSHASLSQLMNHGYWPRNTNPDHIRVQIETLLKDAGLEDADLSGLWDLDPGGSHFQTHPKGVHFPPTLLEPVIEPLEVEVLNPQTRRHFSLFRDPFQDDINGPDDVFLAGDQRYIREAMWQTARHGGFLAVVGESGAGKSVLRRDLIERIHRENAPVVVIAPRTFDKTRLTASYICDAIVADLDKNTRARQSLEVKARQVESLLTNGSRAGNSHVLIIEEAHDLAVPTLKYLKRFWEMEDGFRRLLAIILVGQPELKDRLNERQNPEAREVIRRCELAELQPLDDCLEAYLTHKLARAGAKAADILDPSAYPAIRARLTATEPGTRRAISMTYPLVVNNLVTKAMNRSAAQSAPLVTGDIIREL